MSGNEKKFWLFFILLNTLLFLPAYLVNIDSTAFFPLRSFTQEPWYLNIKSIFKRDNYDIFRLSIDLTILVVIFYFLRKKINAKIYSSIISVYYLLLLLFLVYYHSMFKIYMVEPILFNDIFLLKLGYHNLGANSFWIVCIFLIVAFLYFLVYKLFSKGLSLLQNLVFGKFSKIIIGTFGFLLLFNIIKSGSTLNANHVFQIAGAKIVDNLQRSAESAKNISELSVGKLNKLSESYTKHQLAHKPDVYLLFVESYGKIVYQEAAFRDLYFRFTEQCEKELRLNNWKIVSNLSNSPVSGGGSWISYSSVLFGFRFPNQGTYLYFLRNPEMIKYTNMIRYFQGNGYKSFWINPMPENINMKIPWQLYTDFYSVDEWITYDELNYKGRLYGFGPSPPDQFSFFRADEIINQNFTGPKIVFNITHNSHNPFFCPDSVIQNWCELSNGISQADPPSMFIKKPKPKDYIKSIEYELKTITRFITETNNKNALFIIIGDHQPPVLTNANSGFDTPVHIIAADSTLLNGFKNYGFSDGLLINDTTKGIQHEAIYSMLMREIIRNYGTDTTNLPEFLPYGFKVK